MGWRGGRGLSSCLGRRGNRRHRSIESTGLSDTLVYIPSPQILSPVYASVAVNYVSFQRFANSTPCASVPTLASITHPSLSNLTHSSYKSVSGSVNVSMNSPGSRFGCGFWFSGSDMSTVTWIILRLVLQKPGSSSSISLHILSFVKQ